MKTDIQKKEIHTQGCSRIKQVLEIVPVSNSGLWKWIQQGKFPQPIKVGRASFWRNRDILDWLEKNNL